MEVIRKGDLCLDANIEHVRNVLPGVRQPALVTERPDLYDILYEDFSADLEMYLGYASKHNEILLCGAGTGRTTFPIARAGIRVYAVDSSADMLNVMSEKMRTLPESKNIRIINANMVDFSIGKQFTCCIVPFSTFNYLLTPQDQIRALANIREHVELGGELIMELLTINTFPELLKGRGKLKAFVKESGDERVEMWRKTAFDSATQIIIQEREYRHYKNNKLERCDTVMWYNRFFFLGEIELLLDRCGFCIQNKHGDYQFGVYNDHSDFVVIQAVAR